MASSLDVSNGLRRDVPLSRVARLRTMFQLGAPMPVEEVESKPLDQRPSEPVAFLSEAFQPEPSTYPLPASIDASPAPDGVNAPEVHIQRFRRNRDLFEKLAQPQPIINRVQQVLPSPSGVAPEPPGVPPKDLVMPLFPPGPSSPSENLTTSQHSQPSPPHVSRPPPPPVPAKPKIAKKSLQQQTHDAIINAASPISTSNTSQKEPDSSATPLMQTTQLENNVSASLAEPNRIPPAPITEPSGETNDEPLSTPQPSDAAVISSSETESQSLTQPKPAEQPPIADMVDAPLPLLPPPPEQVDNPSPPPLPPAPAPVSAPEVDQQIAASESPAEVENATTSPPAPVTEVGPASSLPPAPLDQPIPTLTSETETLASPSAPDANTNEQPFVNASVGNETIDGAAEEPPPPEEGDEDDSLDASSLDEESPPRRPSGATEEGTYELESDNLNASTDVHQLADGNFWYERPGPPRDEEHEAVSNRVRFNYAPQRVYTTYSPNEYDRFEFFSFDILLISNLLAPHVTPPNFCGFTLLYSLNTSRRVNLLFLHMPIATLYFQYFHIF